MIWEYTATTALLLMVAAHLTFARVYSERIRQAESDIIEIESEAADRHTEEAIVDRAKMSAQAKVDRTNNHYALFASSTAAGVLIVLTVFHHTSGTTAIDWMALLLLPLPAVILAYHINNVCAFPVRRRLSWSGSSAYSQ